MAQDPNNNPAQETVALRYDKEFNLATAPSRMAKKWANKSTTLSQFVKKLSVTTRTQETFDEYLAMAKGDQDLIKDVGGYVGAMLKGGKRTKEAVANRQLLTFDIDFGTPKTVDKIKKTLSDYAYTISSTHKHSPSKPRFRLIVYPDRPVSVDEYQAVARKVIEKVDIEVIDSGSFDINRLMFWPSCSSDGEFLYHHNDAPFLPVDKVLAAYGPDDAWKDAVLWPRSSRETANLSRLLKKQANPLEKKGLVGALCRNISMRDALKDHLADVYRFEGGDRYTYVQGTSTKGLVVYGELCFSNHDSDIAGGQCLNSFDLIRLHKFGDLDKDTGLEVPTHKLPSYKEMVEWARSIEGVKVDLIKAGIDIEASAFDVFETMEPGADGWQAKLASTDKGAIKPEFNNAVFILMNDPEISGKMKFNEFSMRVENEHGKNWEADNSYDIRIYVGGKYHVDFPEAKVEQAIEKQAYRNKYHPVRDYLICLEWDGIRRVETTFIDYLGVEDNAYTREVTKCFFSAAVHRIFEPGYKFDYAVVIGGPQGIGKTTFLKELALGKWAGELSSFDPKNAMEEINGKWIIEISEMGATNKQALEQQKSFLSGCSTRVRMSYARHPTDFLRQQVFVGTTNQEEYLKDSTGNRRWWPLNATIEMVDIPKLKQEIDQIWAEAYGVLWAQSYPVYLNREIEAMAREVQEEKREPDEWAGIIESWLAEDAPSDRYDSKLGSFVNDLAKRDVVCVAEIWKDCLDCNYEPRPVDRRRIAGIMDNMDGWKRISTMRFGMRFGRQKGWRKGLVLDKSVDPF